MALKRICEHIPPIIRSYENFDRKANSDAVVLTCLDESRAIQSQKDEADINTIVRNFGVTGQLPQGVRVPEYGDFETEVTDYASAVAAIKAADASFMAMPAEVRARFENDPQQFLEFCSDRANLEEMRKLGLAVPPPEPPKAAS